MANENAIGGEARYETFLANAATWLHHEKAAISDLSRTEANRLARAELRRRRTDGTLEDDPRAVWAWLFVEFALYRD